MPKWTPDDHGCIYDEAGCFARLTPNKAERLASRHNADIDALTEERDELQRRLDAVVASLKPEMANSEDERSNELASILYEEYNGFSGDQALMKKYRDDTQEALMAGIESVLADLHARALAIAEGRTP